MAGYGGFQFLTAAENPGIRLGQVPDKFRCCCTSKHTGQRCKNFRVKGSTRCRTHGAKIKVLSRAKQLRLAARMRGERPANYRCD